MGQPALEPGTTPDNKYIDTVVQLAQRGALFLFDLGYFKVNALAQLAETEAYFLTRLNHQTALYAARAGRLCRVELIYPRQSPSYYLSGVTTSLTVVSRKSVMTSLTGD